VYVAIPDKNTDSCVVVLFCFVACGCIHRSFFYLKEMCLFLPKCFKKLNIVYTVYVP
jgi:hypothetical protein